MHRQIYGLFAKSGARCRKYEYVIGTAEQDVRAGNTPTYSGLTFQAVSDELLHTSTASKTDTSVEKFGLVVSFGGCALAG
jgi:hypothetical protein